ncbi:MAG TPA: hypothetical protein VGM29_18855 [Polyangiaceae bacterium]|jgi:uncharacterized tellurite resistance protein B-like protein
MSSLPPSAAQDPKLEFELVKLLLQVAWADDAVQAAEAEALLTYAKRSSLAPEEIELLGRCLAGKAPLPPPNLGFLKEHRVDVLRAVKGLLLSDLHIAEEEEQILGQISQLLR